MHIATAEASGRTIAGAIFIIIWCSRRIVRIYPLGVTQEVIDSHKTMEHRTDWEEEFKRSAAGVKDKVYRTSDGALLTIRPKSSSLNS